MINLIKTKNDIKEGEKVQLVNQPYNADEEYEIEYIFGERRRQNKIEYHVKYLGYPISDSTWETSKNISKPAIIEYEGNEIQFFYIFIFNILPFLLANQKSRQRKTKNKKQPQRK